jgi:23S rRNA (uridine2552-2'-O)-methyltransferase
MKKVQDHYFKQAKRDGYVARSAYKLEEINRKHGLLRSGQKVLDVGCCPGSWMQYTLKQIGERGRLLGVDLQPVTLALPQNAEVVQADVFALDTSDEHWWQEPFDVILSDMAPKTSGVRAADADRSYALNQQVLWLAQQHLKQGGSLLVKAFQGAPFEKLRADFRRMFMNVKTCKPKSSRNESVEIFLLGEKMRAVDEEAD